MRSGCCRWVSAPFRLPETGAVRYEDIQFASGLEHFNGQLLVSYGAADCVSWVTLLPLPPELAALDKVSVRAMLARWTG